jgi:hypothetical protein
MQLSGVSPGSAPGAVAGSTETISLGRGGDYKIVVRPSGFCGDVHVRWAFR